MKLSDEELIQELTTRLAQSRKAFSDLSVVHRKLIEMNHRLEQSEALKSNFLSNIRNEIVNPLNSIIGLSGELTMGGDSLKNVTTIAAMIGCEAAALDFQLRNIFTAAELEAGTLVPHPAKVDVSAIINDVIDSFRPVAARKKVSVQLMSPSAVVFPVDAEKFHLVVSNLLSNGIEYSSQGGTVSLSAATIPNGSLVLTVQDQGAGIAPDDVVRIFDRFVQLETGATRSHRGHGLGLSIVKALADLLEGTVTVDSFPGKGSSFAFTLPAPSFVVEDGLLAEGGNMFLFEAFSE